MKVFDRALLRLVFCYSKSSIAKNGQVIPPCLVFHILYGYRGGNDLALQPDAKIHVAGAAKHESSRILPTIQERGAKHQNICKNPGK